MREVDHRPHPVEPSARSRTTSSIEPSSRTRPITSIPNGTARSFPSSRSRSSPSCSTTESIASSRVRPSRKPGWKTTTSAPGGLRDPGRVVEHADGHVQLLAALGVAHEAGDRRVHRQHDVRCRAALAEVGRERRSPSRSGPRSRSRTPRARVRAARRPPPPGTRGTAPEPGRSGGGEPSAEGIAGARAARRRLAGPSDAVPTLKAHANEALTDRPARARHRPAARRSLARGRRDQRVVARRRRRVHARRLRQGLLRRAHRGAARLALCRSRLSRARRADRSRPRTLRTAS